MRLLLSSKRPTRRKILLLRKISGNSMLPKYPHGKIILAYGIIKKISPGDVIIFPHKGIEKIKCVDKVTSDKVYVLGFNLLESTDSRDFGWIDRNLVLAKVLM